MTDGAKRADAVRVAVIGGGIAGLTAAWHLKERGFEVAVFEERIHLGGKLGAHPGRIPLAVRTQAGADDDQSHGLVGGGQPRGRCEFDEKVRDKSIVPRRSEISSALKDELEADLAKGTVPRWIAEIMLWSVKGRAQRARLAPPPGANLTRFEALKPCLRRGGEHGAVRVWEFHELPQSEGHSGAISPGEKRGLSRSLARFELSLFRRLDDAWVLELSDGVYHEHCYHMYLNWYRNFWALMEGIELERSTHFEPRYHYVHLFPGRGAIAGRSCILERLGTMDGWAVNALSGVASVPDAVLGNYSVLDLVAQRLDPERFLDRQSVHGFFASRWYATEGAVQLHEYGLVRAFSVPSLFSSAYAYRKFLAFCLADPDPMLWVLRGNSYTALFREFEAKLSSQRKGSGSCRVNLGNKIVKFGWDNEGRICDLVLRPSDMKWPRDLNDGEFAAERNGPEIESDFAPHYVIVATPPHALANLLPGMRDRVPGLTKVRKLNSAVSAALDLHFTRKLGDIPKDHVVLRDSRYGLTFFDNSQLWPPEDPGRSPNGATCLNVSVSDFYKLDGMDKQEAMREILDDLRRFIEFEDSDVDVERTYLQLNVNEPLFLNEAGSEQWRPGPVTDVPNLFLAGDYVANDIDVVCVEGAVVSGLLAARAVQARLRQDRSHLPADAPQLRDIPVLMPEALPRVNAEALRVLLTPVAAAARAASRTESLARDPAGELTPTMLQSDVHAALGLPSAVAASVVSSAVSAGAYLADIAVGPPG